MNPSTPAGRFQSRHFGRPLIWYSGDIPAAGGHASARDSAACDHPQSVLLCPRPRL